MGNGGIIPTSKTQTVTFYNTTGLIEKGKNLYFVPRLSKTLATAGQTLSVAYLNEFNRVCPPFSDYSDMDISGWLPTDRTLVVNGNIDDFRLITEVGNCLNYLIITRQVTTNNVSKTYHYAFFITGVNQAGKNSVRVTIEPDDFTDVFYLHNEHVLTQLDINNDYDPFNDKMKNCYVNRQHYNRVKIVNPTYLFEIQLIDVPTVPEVNIGDTIILDLEGASDTIEGTVTYWGDQEEHKVLVRLITDTRVVIGQPMQYSTIIYNGNSYTCDYNYSSIRWTVRTGLEPDNLNIFLNQNESFKFKYQFKDFRGEFPTRASTGITTDTIMNIENESNFSNLTTTEKSILLSSCLSYYVIEAKSIDSIKKVEFSLLNGIPTDTTNVNSTEYINNFVKRTSPLLVIPFIDLPKNYTGLAPKIIYRFNFTNRTVELGRNINHDLLDALLSSLHTNNMDEDILNVYICKSGVFTYFADINVTDQEIIFNFDYNFAFENHGGVISDHVITVEAGYPYFVGLLSDKSKNNPYVSLYIDPLSSEDQYFNFTDYYGAIPALMFSGELVNNIKLEILDKDIPDLKNNYFDNVLESEPYSFYSISYQANEIVLNRARYYQTKEIDIKYSLAFNGQMVINCLPTYNIENVKIPYINEALTVTTSEVTPLVSDRYLSYYYQNMAQMKNQFAVNNYNKGMDLLQHFFLTGPANVGKGGARGGTAGAISALVGEVADMSNEAIDWAQSDKVIDMNQKAKLADMGRAPDTLSQSGTEIYSSILKKEYSLKLNHYRIDEVSYNSIAKYLERYGYNVSLYARLNAMNRVGYNFIQLTNFDWNNETTNKIMVSQQESIKSIFKEGVTLVHNKAYLTSGFNYETILGD